MTDPDTPDLDGSWQVVDIGDTPVLAEAAPTMVFDTVGMRVSGSTGLNRFAGSYAIVQGELRCSPLALTRMAGPPDVMAQESRFAAALAEPVTIRRDGDAVLIGEGDLLLRLVAADDH